MPPNISTRAFIQWLPEKPSEPTSTKVLTSSQRHFVDIRVVANPPPKDIDPKQVEWAFAGHSTSKVQNGKALSQWHHWIDSTTTTPEKVVDKGEMLPEDADGLALEKGEMVNPATGRMTEYVEGWRDVEVSVVPAPADEVVKAFSGRLHERGVRVAGLKSGLWHGGELSSEEDTSLLSVVVQHENAARNARGMVVRVGQICQGVMRVGNEFAYERWEWSSTAGWSKTCTSGNLQIPCDVLTILGDLTGTDTTITYGDGSDVIWQCVEAEWFHTQGLSVMML